MMMGVRTFARVVLGRSFFDKDGTGWYVHEVVGDDQPSLVFTARYVMRRVRAFPSAWCTLPDADLERLSWQR
jgi:hypothetical protein